MTLSAVFQNSFENRAGLPPTAEPYQRRRASESQMGFADAVQPELARARLRMWLSHAWPAALDSRPQFNSVFEKSFSKHVSVLKREPIEVN